MSPLTTSLARPWRRPIVAAAGGPVTTFAYSNFSSGNLLPFTNPWGSGVDVTADPTGSGRVNVMRAIYAPSSGGSMERGAVWSPSGGVRYNREIWFTGDLYLPDNSAAYPGAWNNNHNRKLIDWQGSATRLTLNRNVGNDLRISIVDRMDGTEDENIAETTGITIPKDSWNWLEVRMKTNSADTVRDGIVQIFKDREVSPSYSRTTNLGWITESGGPTSFLDFIVGFQLTINNGDPVYQEPRYWGSMAFSDGRLP